MADPIAYFEPDGDCFAPTVHGIGPWSSDALHGGPPSALLARAIERCSPEPGWHVARLNVELLRPVPLRPLTLRSEIVRPGKSAQRVGASLWEGDREIARALALRIRTAPVDGAPPSPQGDPPRPPDACAPFSFPFFRDPVGYHTSVELRIERGEFWRTPVRMWMRPRCALVAGEPLSALERVVVCADSGNGVSPVLDTSSHTFLNADLDVHLHRVPQGEWICLDACTIVEPHGIGMADTRLWDEHGPIGRGVQMLVVRPR